jgi:hypothetical protein
VYPIANIEKEKGKQVRYIYVEILQYSFINSLSITNILFVFAVVKEGSRVAVEMTIRCKSMATATEPGGLLYFSTKDDTQFNELAFTVGSGEVLPSLEEGMMGMHKNGLRRIEVPSTMVYQARKSNQLPLPTTKDGKRRFENLFKMDGTLLFEVLVTRIK